MNKIRYASIEDWKIDMDYIRDNPNDSVFFNAVVRRVESSPKNIKLEIQDYLSGLALERNPWIVFEQITKENPEFTLIANNSENPWFNA